MKIGIDLGTTNCALAYIDEREAEDLEFPPVHVFETPQLVAAGRVEPRRTLPSFLFLEFRCRPHRQDPPLGFARNRPRAVAGGSLRALSRQVPRRVGPRKRHAAR